LKEIKAHGKELGNAEQIVHGALVFFPLLRTTGKQTISKNEHAAFPGRRKKVRISSMEGRCSSKSVTTILTELGKTLKGEL
jgi:hypothetical protein